MANHELFLDPLRKLQKTKVALYKVWLQAHICAAASFQVKSFQSSYAVAKASLEIDAQPRTKK